MGAQLGIVEVTLQGRSSISELIVVDGLADAVTRYGFFGACLEFLQFGRTLVEVLVREA